MFPFSQNSSGLEEKKLIKREKTEAGEIMKLTNLGHFIFTHFQIYQEDGETRVDDAVIDEAIRELEKMGKKPHDLHTSDEDEPPDPRMFLQNTFQMFGMRNHTPKK